MDRGCVVVLIMLDLTAAFDTINHAIQLSRLTHNYGVTGAALKWFTSYLSGRQQLVCIGSDKSSPTHVPFGVPRGSLLGSLLFTEIGMDYHLYADDAQLYVSFCPGGDDQLNAIDPLCSCLGEIGKWSRANLLKLNDGKTDVVMFGTKHKLNDDKTDVVVFGTKHKLNDEKTDVVVFGTKHKLNDEKTDVVVFGTKHKLPLMKDIRITIRTTTLNASSNVRNLGVVLDSSLCMTNYISATTCRTAYMYLQNISRIRRYLTIYATKLPELSLSHLSGII